MKRLPIFAATAAILIVGTIALRDKIAHACCDKGMPQQAQTKGGVMK